MDILPTLTITYDCDHNYRLLIYDHSERDKNKWYIARKHIYFLISWYYYYFKLIWGDYYISSLWKKPPLTTLMNICVYSRIVYPVFDTIWKS